MPLPIAPIIAGAVGAGLGTGGDIISTIMQQNFNRAEAQKQRDFEERMSNTAIQRQFADAKKAGISPLMLMGNSAGAGTPSGASASASKGNLGGEMSNAVNGLINALINDRRMDSLERMNSDRIDAREDLTNYYWLNKNNLENRRMLNNWQINKDNLDYKRDIQHVNDFLKGYR